MEDLEKMGTMKLIMIARTMELGTVAELGTMSRGTIIEAIIRKDDQTAIGAQCPFPGQEGE